MSVSVFCNSPEFYAIPLNALHMGFSVAGAFGHWWPSAFSNAYGIPALEVREYFSPEQLEDDVIAWTQEAYEVADCRQFIGGVTPIDLFTVGHVSAGGRYWVHVNRFGLVTLRVMRPGKSQGVCCLEITLSLKGDVCISFGSAQVLERHWGILWDKFERVYTDMFKRRIPCVDRDEVGQEEWRANCELAHEAWKESRLEASKKFIEAAKKAATHAPKNAELFNEKVMELWLAPVE
jgi:hypothetical protein